MLDNQSDLDAEAICNANSSDNAVHRAQECRTTIRSPVAPNCELLVRQRTMLINALRGALCRIWSRRRPRAVAGGQRRLKLRLLLPLLHRREAQASSGVRSSIWVTPYARTDLRVRRD